MSIKLYDGFKLEGVSSIEDALIFSEEIRKPIKSRIMENMAKEIKTLACLMYDLNSFDIDMFEDEEDRKPLLASTIRLMEQHRKEKHGTEFSIGFAQHEGHVLGYPFFPDNGYNDIIFDHPKVQRFGYWDNTDPEENITEEEWGERERLWDLVFEKEAVYNKSMLIIVLVDKHIIIPSDENMEALPTIDEREKAVANQLAWAEASKEYDPSANNLYDTMMKVKELMPKYLKEVNGKLKSDITLKTLEQPLPIKMENINGPK